MDEEALVALDPPPSESPPVQIGGASQLGTRTPIPFGGRLRSLLAVWAIARDWMKSISTAFPRSPHGMRRVTGVLWILWGLLVVSALWLRLEPWKQFFWEPFVIGLSAIGVGLGLLLMRSWRAHIPSMVLAAPLLALALFILFLNLAMGRSKQGVVAGSTLTIGIAGYALLVAWRERIRTKTGAEQRPPRVPPFLAALFWTSISSTLITVLSVLIASASARSDPIGNLALGLFIALPMAFSALASIVLAILTAWRWRSLSRMQRWRGMLPLSLPLIAWSLILLLG